MADLKRHEELIVITKTYDLILWSCNHTSKFPRNHRFVLGERIERNLYDLLEILLRAKYTRQRQELLEKANLMLEILRFQMRLAKDLQCLKFCRLFWVSSRSPPSQRGNYSTTGTGLPGTNSASSSPLDRVQGTCWQLDIGGSYRPVFPIVEAD